MWRQAATPQCALCECALDPNNHFYGDRGPLCDRCEFRGGQQARFFKEHRAAGYGALAASLVALFANPYWVLSFVAASSAAWTLRSSRTRDPAEIEILRTHPGPKRAAFVAIPLTALGVVIGVLQWSALIVSFMA